MTADTNEDNNKEVVTCANFELLPPENSNDNGDSDGNGEIDIDLALVDSAVTEIKHIFIKHVESTILEVGKLLIKEFYNNNIELARNNKPTKEKSLSQVIKMLQIKGDLHPSKTWLYNSVRLVVDNSDLGENYSSGKLSLTHKVLITNIKDVPRKLELIESVVSKNLSVSELREEINKTKSKKESGIVRLLKQPAKLFNLTIDEILPSLELKKLTGKKLIKVKETLDNEIESVKNELK